MSNMPASTSDSIDYIRYVMPYASGFTGALPNLSDFENNEKSPIKPRAFFGYTETKTLPCGIVMMRNPEREEMGICVQIAGDALRVIERDITSPWCLLRFADESEAHIKRVDYAIDMVGEEALTPGALASATEAGTLTFKGKSWQWVERTPKGASRRAIAGSTLYLGSRSSDRFVRYYDKAAQQKIMGVSWARLEIELKDRRAEQYAQNASAGDWMRHGRGQIFDYMRVNNDDSILATWYAQLIANQPHSLPGKLSRLASKPDIFVENIVVPFLRNHAVDLSELNLMKLRTLVNGELFARDWSERELDTDWGIDVHV